jgi:hypothetical protein
MLQGRWRQGFAGVEGTSGQKSLVRITLGEPVYFILFFYFIFFFWWPKSTAERDKMT